MFAHTHTHTHNHGKCKQTHFSGQVCNYIQTLKCIHGRIKYWKRLANTMAPSEGFSVFLQSLFPEYQSKRSSSKICHFTTALKTKLNGICLGSSVYPFLIPLWFFWTPNNCRSSLCDWVELYCSRAPFLLSVEETNAMTQLSLKKNRLLSPRKLTA